MARTVVRLTMNRFAQIAAKLPREAHAIVQGTVLDIETRVKTEMAGPKSGRMYGGHQASAPGEAPAVDTGALISSVQTDVQGTEGSVYTNMEYAPYLEYGTSQMAPRPFFTPAAEAARSDFERKMRDLEDRLG